MMIVGCQHAVVLNKRYIDSTTGRLIRSSATDDSQPTIRHVTDTLVASSQGVSTDRSSQLQ